MAIRIKWNVRQGAFEEIRRLPAVEAEIARKVTRVKTEVASHGEYAGGTEDGGDRVRGYVVTTNGKAIRAESADHVLQRALANLQSGGSS